MFKRFAEYLALIKNIKFWGNKINFCYTLSTAEEWLFASYSFLYTYGSAATDAK